MKKLIKNFKQITVLFLALIALGCQEDEAVLPQVVANFTYTLNADNGTVTFINVSENANTYEWDFGDENTSTEINPVKIYENGTYTVTLKAKNVSGATDTFEDEIVVLIPEIATLPITFDGENTKYDAQVFSGAAFSVVDNPDPSGVNNTVTKVGKIVNSGAAYEGFYLDLGAPINLTTDKTIQVMFWSDTAVDILLKLEEGTGAAVETTAGHSGSGWEMIYFSFDSSASYSRFTMFVDGPGTSSGTFYIDNISQIKTADIPCLQTNLELPIDFDCNGIDYTSKIVGNVSFNVLDNPETSGINAQETKVGVITNSGEAFENAFFNLDTPIDFTTLKGIRFKLFSDQALPIKLKLEDGTEAPIEVDVNHTGSGWEELTFTFTSTASYNDMVLFVDGPGTSVGTFYIDDITQVTGEVANPCTAETMQSLSGADLNLTFMSDPSASIIEDGGDFQWIDNPDFDNDVNMSCKVGQITKLGNNPWDNNQIDLDSKLDFDANTGLKIKVWSSRPNTEVRIKLEEIGNAGNNVEQFLTTSVTSGWEELTFPFTSADSNKFNKIVIFFDLNANNTDTYYFDDLALYGSGSGGGGGGAFDSGLLVNGDFENGASPWTIGVGSDPVPVVTDAGNTYYSVDVTAAGNAFDVNMSQKLAITQDATYTLTFDAWSDRSRTILAGIGLSGGDFSNTTEAVNLTAVRQTFTLTLTATGFGAPDARVLFDSGAEIGLVNIDNVSLVLDGTGGGGGAGGGGELIPNGDFEAGNGDGSGWLFFDNGGSSAISSDFSSGGGVYSAKITAGQFNNPGVKAERVGVGVVSPNQLMEVVLDSRVLSLADGAVVNVLAFSESAVDGEPAILHNLGTVNVTPGVWNTNTFTFTSGGTVSGGISLLIEVVCGGATTCDGTVYIDNVSLKIK
ncbi:carbohydrate binding domain-containing protein [Gaetbulibacter sp. M240]|uniref:carbohydrate binding domain-containing protein n=1 Tax=Gaetbulibacter sp. M240 TaxID=3126511 RepID=UPI00374FAABB